MPTFLWSDEPVAVNPNGPLQRLAKSRGWAIEDWGSATSAFDPKRYIDEVVDGCGLAREADLRQLT